jgi:glycosyltransferase involved in cell wall biosynthesis
MNFSQFKTNFEKKVVFPYPSQVPNKVVLSVCVQTYNQANFIEKSLETILAQKTNFKYEILLGDDESSDGTREICIEYAKKYPDKIRLFLHHRENNIKIEGKSTGIFNSLYNLFSSTGDFIAYCDGDDFWRDEKKLQKQVDYLRNHPETVLTYHNINLINQEGRKIEKNNYFTEAERDFSADELSKALIQPPTCTWCFRNIIKDIPIEFTKTFNGDNFWISLLGNYGNGRYLKDIQPSYYRIHNAAMWSTLNKSSQFRSKFYTYLKLSDYYKRIENASLANYFRLRAKSHGKMLLNDQLRNLRIKEFILFYKVYLNT